MCPGGESLEGSEACELAGHVFAVLPWPCIVWRHGDGRAALVSPSFRCEFGIGDEDVEARWIEDHLLPGRGNDEFVYRGHTPKARRYRLIRRTIDLPTATLEAAFLLPMPAADLESPAPFASAFTALRPEVGLTPRETQVLEGIMRGKLNKVIAGELAISPKTVELHRANLMAKLRVHNVVELARAVLDGPPPRGASPLGSAQSVDS